jgi:iron complex transport system substrate-binding protein
MASAGLTNIAADSPEPWVSYSWEAVAAAQPDVIVLVDADWNTAISKINFLAASPLTAHLEAVVNQRYVILPFAATQPGIRTVEATQFLADQLAILP